MKSKVAAALAALLVLTGCGSSDGAQPSDTASASATAETTLTQWVKDTGFFTSITVVTNGLSADVANLTNTDVKAANAAFTARSAALQPVIATLSGIGATDDAQFETLRGTMVTALQAFAEAAGTLGAATAKTRPAALAATTSSMTALTAAVQAVVDYINANGTETLRASA